MTKRFHLRQSGRSAWIALALAVLMVAGAVTDALAQTRVRGGIIVDCSKEKSKKTTLSGGQKEAKFRIINCYCGPKENDLADTKKRAADALAELAAYLNTGKGGKKVTEMVKAYYAADNSFKEPALKTRQYETMDAWLRKHGLYVPTFVRVAPPAGCRKSKTHYCYDSLNLFARGMIPSK